LLLPNAWDAATARAVAAAGFAAVATTSGGVAAALGYEDHHRAPAEEMFAAAARIARALDVPVTVDAEAGYGMGPAELVSELRRIGAAGCNLEDTDHRVGRLRDPEEQAEWLGDVRQASSEAGYPIVINARIDVFLATVLGGGAQPQGELLGEGLTRAARYLAAGADCVYPIALWEPDAIRSFVSEAGGPVNALAIPNAPSVPELAELGVARVSWGTLLYHATLASFTEALEELEAGRSG
jgi:2-methylisocitrate lyase-like PEP mutase family enzyme